MTPTRRGTSVAPSSSAAGLGDESVDIGATSHAEVARSPGKDGLRLHERRDTCLGKDDLAVRFLPAALDTTSAVSPFFQTFLAAQVTSGARGFLSKGVTVAAMHQQSGDIHHIVPKDYLVKNGYPDRGDYNQVANFALTETAINIAISNRAPAEYMAIIQAQIRTGDLRLGEITSQADLTVNLRENAVPTDIGAISAGNYREFLAKRRRLMAAIIRDYYSQI